MLNEHPATNPITLKDSKPDGYNWGSYTLGVGNKQITEYCPAGMSSFWGGEGSPDNKTVLDESDDAANVKLGGKWRIPTETEWSELKNNCVWTWTTKNGIEGCLVKSKMVGHENNSIFLPITGLFGNDRRFDLTGGYYWSSSLKVDKPVQHGAFILVLNYRMIFFTKDNAFEVVWFALYFKNKEISYEHLNNLLNTLVTNYE